VASFTCDNRTSNLPSVARAVALATLLGVAFALGVEDNSQAPVSGA
jgi:hypothetical protein